MSQDAFASARRARWGELEALLASLRRRRSGPVSGAEHFPRLYRAACDDLAVARHRRFDAQLVRRLEAMVVGGHLLLYRPVSHSLRRALSFFGGDFPRAVRREWRLVALAAALFYGTGAAVALALSQAPELVYAVLSPEQVRSLEGMYNPQSRHFLRPRGAATDTAMFGFYIYNNISIALRTFAGGIFAGVGSLFIAVYNGVFLGAVTAHLVSVGFGQTLGTFVVGHGSLELTALVLSAAAGLRLGWAVVAPGSRSRVAAVRMAATRAVPLVYGSFVMLVGAAAVEAYWSASTVIDGAVKVGVGVVGWAAVLLYLAGAGRRRA